MQLPRPAPRWIDIRPLKQAILTGFILDGHFGHHVRRMRQTRTVAGSRGSRPNYFAGSAALGPSKRAGSIGWLSFISE
jgi:hypothetical protein